MYMSMSIYIYVYTYERVYTVYVCLNICESVRETFDHSLADRAAATNRNRIQIDLQPYANESRNTLQQACTEKTRIAHIVYVYVCVYVCIMYVCMCMCM